MEGLDAAIGKPGSKMAMILDQQAGLCKFILYDQKKIIVRSLLPVDLNDPMFSTSPWNSKPVGTKTIDSHPCQAYELGSTSKGWIADDIHCLVRLEQKSANTTTVTELKSYSPKPPDQNLLEIPADFTPMGTIAR